MSDQPGRDPGDPIGDAPDADPELVRDRPSSGAVSLRTILVALAVVVLIVLLLVFLL